MSNWKFASRCQIASGLYGPLELQPATERDVRKIHKFYEQLLFNVESLRTLGKFETIEGASFFNTQPAAVKVKFPAKNVRNGIIRPFA
jgi:hypothetical protein